MSDTPNTAKSASTDSGLDQNVAAALAYLFITGIIFIFTEKKNKFVRFHSFQAVLFGIASMVIGFFTGLIFSWLFFFIATLVNLALFVYWLYVVYKAYSGEMYKIPVIGDIAEKEAMKNV